MLLLWRGKAGQSVPGKVLNGNLVWFKAVEQMEHGPNGTHGQNVQKHAQTVSDLELGVAQILLLSLEEKTVREITMKLRNVILQIASLKENGQLGHRGLTVVLLVLLAKERELELV